MQLLLLIIAEIKRIYLAFILITNEYEKEIYCFSLVGRSVSKHYHHTVHLEKRDRDLGDFWGLSQKDSCVACR